MKYIITLSILFLFTNLFSQEEECTIGVANGTATQDGRPMIWKTRDYSAEPSNEVRYNYSFKYKFIYVAGAGNGTAARMGVNEHGFAMMNSTSDDMPNGSSTGLNNGETMRNALGTCKTVADFQHYLDSTNITGRNTNANYGAMDASGVAAIFETGELVYYKYDAADSPNGYVLRTNFAINGDGTGSGTERLIRTVKLVGDFHKGDSLNYKSILRHQMRDFSDYKSAPYAIPFMGSMGGQPYGYIETAVSICRNSSVSAAVIHGVLPNEDPLLSTMWTILGQPASSVALPYWPIGYTPAESDGLVTAQLADVANLIRSYLFDANDASYINTVKLRDGSGGGLFAKTFPFEDETFETVNNLMETWRSKSVLPTSEMRTAEDSLAALGYEFLLSCVNVVNSNEEMNKELHFSKVFPNPFSTSTELSYTIESNSSVDIKIYSLSGALLESVNIENLSPGSHQYKIGSNGIMYPEGILILKLTVNGKSQYHKIVKMQ
ncbi:MAG: T9SS type A sorting domain-containing protein [Bacteroidales bacterium]|nr:T9SS type A sorting domain-containing protein [Bacteroidales bacterium]MCF8406019.1 T9SS type A sorting domain-containing protein [Bacteroidales bacterium]